MRVDGGLCNINTADIGKGLGGKPKQRAIYVLIPTRFGCILFCTKGGTGRNPL